MQQQEVIDNDTVFTSATEHILFAGCDYRLFWAMSGICFISCIALFGVIGDILRVLPAWIGVAGVWWLSRFGLRRLAKYDPLIVPIYLRHIQYPEWMPAYGKLLKQRRPMRIAKRRRL